MGQLRVLVAVNEFGRRIGETHHNAIISDAVVDEIRSAHEDSRRGYLEISQEFDIALTTVRKICTYERRAQTPERWKTLRGGLDASRERVKVQQRREATTHGVALIPVTGDPKPMLMHR